MVAWLQQQFSAPPQTFAFFFLPPFGSASFIRKWEFKVSDADIKVSAFQGREIEIVWQITGKDIFIRITFHKYCFLYS